MKTRYPVAAVGAQASASCNPTYSAGDDCEVLSYDANDNVVTHRKRDGQLVNFSYDALGRMTYKDVPNIVSGELDVTTTYDNLGRPVNVTDTANNFVGSSFDALGRMTRQSSPFGNIDMAYDVAGRLTRVTHPDALFFDYVYDTAGLTAIRENGSATNLIKYEYDDLGRRTRIVRRNGATSVTWTNIAYDPLGRLKSYSQDLGGSANDLSVAGPGNGGTSITYNPASQLTGITRSNPTDLYAWTGHYNINRAYGTNGLNQLTSAGSTALGYDGRGNLTSSGSDSYAYTSENRLATFTIPVQNGQPQVTTLLYDPTGRLSRITKQQGTSTLSDTRFEYLGPRLIAERDANGNIIRRYVHGPGDDEPVVWYEGSTLAAAGRRFLHADERGSVIAVTDFTGNSLATIKYDEYGIPQANVALATGTVGRFLYTGQAWIPELGLYYYKARMYSPLLGRFMQTDPIGYEDGVNWYNYVDDDPINRVDSDGEESASITRDSVAQLTSAQASRPATQADREALSVMVSVTPFIGTVVGVVNAVSGKDVITGQKLSKLERVTAVLPTKALGKVAGTVRTVCCFAAGTEVLTENGSVALEKLSVGDRVWAENPQTGAKGWRAITKLYVNDSKPLWELKLFGLDGDETHRVTDNHPYWVQSLGWVEVKDLKPGMALLSRDGEAAWVRSAINTGQIELTYNLEVEGLHSFFVGKLGILVHNGCFPRGVKNAVRRANPNCEKCGKPTTWGKADSKGVRPSGNRSEIHHKEEAARGGSNQRSNAENLCRDCHIEKHKKKN